MTQDQIFKKLGISDASAELKQKVLQGLVRAVELQFATVIDNALTDEQATELQRVIDQSGDDALAVEQWLHTHIPEAAGLYHNLLEEQIETLKDELDQASHRPA